MTFEFATAARVIFGRGAVKQLPALIRPLGARLLVVTGAQPHRHASLLAELEAVGLAVATWPVAGEPAIADIEQGAALAQTLRVEAVVGLGGGSAIDAAKAIAAMTTQRGGLFHYLEVIGQGRALDATPLPIIAVPTTAGTGAEVTRNAVISSPAHGLKVSLRHPSMLPAVALVDPELARECPPHVTAASGMDALVQCLEAFVSRKAQPLTDALCLEGIRRAVRSLEAAVTDGDNLDAREDLAFAALVSGMALANAGLGAVHGLAAPIGGRFHAPHGAVCAALLAPVWAANLRKLRATGDADALGRFQQIARLLRPDDLNPPPEAATGVFRDLASRLEIPPLGRYDIQRSHFDELAIQAAASSSMQGNPVKLEQPELIDVLRAAS